MGTSVGTSPVNQIERRCGGPRLALDATAIIRVDILGPAVQSRIINASQRGMLLVMPEARPVGTKIRVTVQIEDPLHEITVSGIIVHATSMEAVDPRFTARIGILITEAGDDWRALCDGLARLSAIKGG